MADDRRPAALFHLDDQPTHDDPQRRAPARARPSVGSRARAVLPITRLIRQVGLREREVGPAGRIRRLASRHQHERRDTARVGASAASNSKQEHTKEEMCEGGSTYRSVRPVVGSDGCTINQTITISTLSFFPAGYRAMFRKRTQGLMSHQRKSHRNYSEGF